MAGRHLAPFSVGKGGVFSAGEKMTVFIDEHVLQSWAPVMPVTVAAALPADERNQIDGPVKRLLAEQALAVTGVEGKA